jgi:hypothetical protein
MAAALWRLQLVIAKQGNIRTFCLTRSVASMRFDRLLMALSLLLLSPAAWPQAPASAASYDPRVTFAPLTLPDPVNAYRSSDGAPGPAYWQNQADYEMHAALDTTAKVLRNDEVITYTNNSPDSLTSLWIQLDQNIYRPDSRARIVSGGLRRKTQVPDSEDNPNGRTAEGDDAGGMWPDERSWAPGDAARPTGWPLGKSL